jgi:hypothetical protein
VTGTGPGTGTESGTTIAAGAGATAEPTTTTMTTTAALHETRSVIIIIILPDRIESGRSRWLRCRLFPCGRNAVLVVSFWDICFFLRGFERLAIYIFVYHA